MKGSVRAARQELGSVLEILWELESVFPSVSVPVSVSVSALGEPWESLSGLLLVCGSVLPAGEPR